MAGSVASVGIVLFIGVRPLLFSAISGGILA
jgi:hypothetical protein